MKTERFWMLTLVLTGFLQQTGSAQPTASNHAPVLVELFTSQGCSSCPPAEKILNEWGMEQFQKGKIIPLAFHVDYWDYLGWKDPFSSTLFTTRQRGYARALSSDSLYTPQMVVAGKVGFVGSDATRAEWEVAAQAPKPGLLFSLKASKEPAGFHLRIVAPIPEQGTVNWFAVLFQNGLSTQVQRGENAGSLLMENFVVRSFEKMIDSLKTGTPEALIPLEPAWDLSQCGLVVFAQDKGTMEIMGAKCLFPVTTALSEKIP